MSSTNQGPEYFSAEKRYLSSGEIEEKIYWLQEMMRNFKKHKGSEKMLAELKKRLIKLKEKQEKNKKTGKGKKGIRKEGYQVILIGKTNSGKSSLLGALTNAHPKISENKFSTKAPEIGAMDYQGVKSQIVDLPSIGNKEFDYGIVNTADCLLLVVEKLDDLKDVNSEVGKAGGDKIIVVNKIDRLNDSEKRKLNENCKSKRLKDFVLVSAKAKVGLDGLKKKIFEKMGVIRVFTKEPGKAKTNDPVVLDKGANVRELAEKIYKGFSRQIKETKLTGPSGKFANQKVGLNHKLADMDVVEFKT